MGKLFLIACLVASFMYGSQAQGFDLGEDNDERPGENEILSLLENDLKDFRMELERLNVTHEIPGICSVCKWVLGKIIPKMHHHLSKWRLKSLMRQACRGSVFFRWACNKFVNSYIDIIFDDILKKHMHVPNLICKAMRLCWWPAAEKKHKQIL